MKTESYQFGGQHNGAFKSKGVPQVLSVELKLPDDVTCVVEDTCSSSKVLDFEDCKLGSHADSYRKWRVSLTYILVCGAFCKVSSVPLQ